MHKLFDNGLLKIDENYKVQISPEVKSEDYQKYDGCRINLPSNTEKHPAKKALRDKAKEFRG